MVLSGAGTERLGRRTARTSGARGRLRSWRRSRRFWARL